MATEGEVEESKTTPPPADAALAKQQSMALAQVRPSRLSMEGYIYNANMVLETALSPKTHEVPVELMEKCKGLCILTIYHVGAIVTLYYGTGVIFKKKTTEEGAEDDDGSFSWSPPSAVSVGGTSFGAVLGGKRDNSLIFIMDDETMKDFCLRPQTRLGLDAAVTAGNIGGDANLGMDNGTVTFSFTSGAYAAAAVQMCTLETVATQNEVFYGKKVKAKDILLKSGEEVKVPEDSQIPDLYEKLDLLAKGETWEPGENDISRSSRFLERAQSTSVRFKSGEFKEEEEAKE